MKPIRAVLLDFAGTLLVPEPRDAWVAGVSPGLSSAEVADRAARLEREGRSGGPEPTDLGDLAEAYGRRDLSAREHRHAYEGFLRRVVAPELVGPLYERGLEPAGWVPYPDALPVLTELRARGILVAVVSNVGFDLPRIFAGHGLADLVDAFVLSYEVGVMKPGPAIFAAALAALGVQADEALMVGDNPRADNGGVDLGIRTLLLPYSAAGSDHGLRAVLGLVGR